MSIIQFKIKAKDSKMTKPESLIRRINSLTMNVPNNGRCEQTNARSTSPSLAKTTENLNLVYGSIHRLHHLPNFNILFFKKTMSLIKKISPPMPGLLSNHNWAINECVDSLF